MSHYEIHPRPDDPAPVIACDSTGSARGPVHTAIIMDGNGRWAVRRGLPRTAGHREGAKAVDAVVQAAADPQSGIRWLTLFAFSSDNWRRPVREVGALMRLFREYLRREAPRMSGNGIRLEVVGRRDRLSPALVDAIEETEAATARGDALTLRLAVDYSARDAIVQAARAMRRPPDPDHPALEPPLDRSSFSQLLGRVVSSPSAPPTPDVDLLIRTAGEQRLSDFLLWEVAYAELYFTQVLWPDFGARELAAAVAEYRRRERRFGGVLEEAV